jgi:hypothetical protein
MLVGRAAEEMKLLSVTAAPFAEEQMKSESESLPQWQTPIEGVGLEPAGLAAGGHLVRNPGLRAESRRFKKCM